MLLLLTRAEYWAEGKVCVVIVLLLFVTVAALWWYGPEIAAELNGERDGEE